MCWCGDEVVAAGFLAAAVFDESLVSQMGDGAFQRGGTFAESQTKCRNVDSGGVLDGREDGFVYPIICSIIYPVIYRDNGVYPIVRRGFGDEPI
jgi:hypothetical protein